MSSPPQKIILPWNTKRWLDLAPKITAQVSTIVDFDTIITGVHMGKLRPRQITELFNSYYSDEQYATHRIEAADMLMRIIPRVQSLLKEAPKTFKGVNLQALSEPSNIVLTRPQVATIVSAMWFGLFDYDYLTKGPLTIDEFPEPTFINAFAQKNVFALQCILTYFDTVDRLMTEDGELFAASLIILKRSTLAESPNWVDSETPLCSIEIGREMYIDREPHKVLTAFAHEFIGGEMFKAALSQEEITLLIFPECLVATLFCSRLGPRDTVTVLGAAKMSAYMGYGSSIKYLGIHTDAAGYGYSMGDTEALLQRAIVFADASPHTSVKSQFIDDFLRDLDKLYCGYSSLMFSDPGEPVVGGNWSYGFNGTNMQVKLLQQILAASQAHKTLVYCPMGDMTDRLQEYLFYLKGNDKFTVGAVLRAYLQIIRDNQSGHLARLHDLDLITCVIQSILF